MSELKTIFDDYYELRRKLEKIEKSMIAIKVYGYHHPEEWKFFSNKEGEEAVKFFKNEITRQDELLNKRLGKIIQLEEEIEYLKKTWWKRIF